MSQTTVAIVETGDVTVDAAPPGTGRLAVIGRSWLCLLVAPLCAALAVAALAVAAARRRRRAVRPGVVRAALVVAWAVAGHSRHTPA